MAPSMASCTLSTPFSASTKAVASSSIVLVVACARKISASGSKPFSLAIVALVRRFGRYGRYRSSNATIVITASICFFNSSVSLPCSSIVASTDAFFSSKFRRYTRRSDSARNCSSFKEPVTSFRYLAINGIVAPSSISSTDFST